RIGGADRAQRLPSTRPARPVRGAARGGSAGGLTAEARQGIRLMTAKKDKLSVVCPALNEEEGLPLFHRELCRVLDSLADVCDYEVIYSDDGSSDGTLAVLRRWASV